MKGRPAYTMVDAAGEMVDVTGVTVDVTGVNFDVTGVTVDVTGAATMKRKAAYANYANVMMEDEEEIAAMETDMDDGMEMHEQMDAMPEMATMSVATSS
eukprot:4820857-Pyramimonas_sp.AAC.1